jgi:acetamidase/formamidase
MGVAPPANDGRISTKELGEGAALCLPVWVEGADCSAGDGPGVPGDGEVCIQWAGNLPDRHLRRRIISLITSRTNPSREQAYQFSSLAADFHVIQTVNGETAFCGPLRKGLLF